MATAMGTEHPPEVVVAIEREGGVVVAQRRARLYAAALGFARQAQWEVATAVSEAAANMLKYARSGHIVLRAVGNTGHVLEFEAVDRGSGIADLALAMKDGVSEGRDLTVDAAAGHRRGLGLGLGAIRRLMDDLQVFSTGDGTRLVARKSRMLPDGWPAPRGHRS
jgi:serine/threonine-protein kinase RsbT